jgi:hypothetical protein
MEYKNIRLIIIAVISLIIVPVGFSDTVTKNHNNVMPKTTQKTQSTTYVLKLGSQSPKAKDGQR